MTTVRRMAVALLLVSTAGACGGSSRTTTTTLAPPVSVPRIQLTSPDFADGAPIPRRFTCDGDNAPPTLEWAGLPPGTTSLALVVEDPDAPSGTFVHWVALGIRPDDRGFPGHGLSGVTQPPNSAGQRAYTGPCPPRGSPAHHYVFTLYALRSPVADRAAAAGQAIGLGRLTGTYAR